MSPGWLLNFTSQDNFVKIAPVWLTFARGSWKENKIIQLKFPAVMFCRCYLSDMILILLENYFYSRVGWKAEKYGNFHDNLLVKGTIISLVMRVYFTDINWLNMRSHVSSCFSIYIFSKPKFRKINCYTF